MPIVFLYLSCPKGDILSYFNEFIFCCIYFTFVCVVRFLLGIITILACKYLNLILLLQGDVYPVEPYDDLSVKQVLDAHWGVLYDEDVRYLCV